MILSGSEMFSEVLKCSHCEGSERFHEVEMEVPSGSIRFHQFPQGSTVFHKVPDGSTRF